MNSETLQDLRPVVVYGPSGVGKGTLIQKLLDTHPDLFSFAVSHTTRSPRPGEQEGDKYHFVSEAQFAQLVAADAFVEHTTFSGNHYGTSRQTVAEQLAKGKVVLLDIDIEGVKRLKSSPDLAARYVFIEPPSLEVLGARLRGRGTEEDADVEKRLARAREELEYARLQRGHDAGIVNDDIDKAYAELFDFALGLGENKYG